MKPAPVCYDVAQHFLGRVKSAGPEDIQELAERVQELCEEIVSEYLGEPPEDN